MWRVSPFSLPGFVGTGTHDSSLDINRHPHEVSCDVHAWTRCIAAYCSCIYPEREAPCEAPVPPRQRFVRILPPHRVVSYSATFTRPPFKSQFSTHNFIHGNRKWTPSFDKLDPQYHRSWFFGPSSHLRALAILAYSRILYIQELLYIIYYIIYYIIL